MATWIALHWTDILLHLGLDLTGGLTLRCAMGMCEHRRHQIAVWVTLGIIFSMLTVYLVG